MGNLSEFLKTNLSHVAPILIAGAFALVIMIERAKALLLTYPLPNTSKFFEKLRDMVLADRIAEALALCDKYDQSPVAQVAREALLRINQPESLIEHGLEIVASESSQKIQRRTSFLATIANVSTLLGLFGTIAGLIHSFEAVGHADAQQKSALLAAGISTAMNATMLGLGVAIPCMIAFSFLMNRTNRLNAEIEQAAVRSLDLVKQRFYAQEPLQASGGSRGGHARSM